MDFLIILLGLLFGSFYNVVIYRVPLGKSIVKPPSSCGVCNRRLSAIELVPVLSYMIQGGKCKGCSTKISFRYPFVEILTAALFYLCFYVIGFRIELLRALFLVSMFIIISFIDFDHHELQDRFNILLLVSGIAYLMIFKPFPVMDAVYGFLVGAGFLFILMFFGMGGADVKFMGAMGVWLGLGYTIMALEISFVVGGVLSILILLIQKVFKVKIFKTYAEIYGEDDDDIPKERLHKSAIAFLPYLCMGSFIALLFGKKLFLFYVNNFLMM